MLDTNYVLLFIFRYSSHCYLGCVNNDTIH